MGDISLDDLLTSKKAELETAPQKAEELSVAVVERQIETLSPEERQRVDKIKSELDLRDSNAVISFGAPAQKEIAAFSDNILNQVRAKDSGEVGVLLTDLVKKVKGFELESGGGSFLDKIPFLGGIKNKIEEKKLSYDKLSAQVDRIAGSLEESRMKMMRDVAVFDALYEKNLSYFKDLQIYIQAGEEKLEEMRNVTLPKLRNQAAASVDPMAVQVVQDFEDSVNRFEKKVHDLKISKTIAVQTAPQIRLIQNNDKALVDKVQTAIYSTLPLWRNQLVIALGLAAQSETIKLQRAVTDATNDLMRKNAEMLKQNTIDVARETERGIVDIETVRKVNDDLISTIEETLKIQAEGKAKRAAAEAELVQIEGRIKETLLRQRG